MTIAALAVALAVVGGSALSAQDKYALQLPGGVAFADFTGYENWQLVSVSQTDDRLKVILANPTMIDAFKAGVPGSGKRFPEGSKHTQLRDRCHKAVAAKDYIFHPYQRR